jgi:ferric-dicitrate binding protein FerR (iron transport regulator)
MPGLEERLRDLPLRAPLLLRDRALRAAQEEPPAGRRTTWLQTAAAIVVVAMVVILTLTVTVHPDPRIFSNISAGLGT